MSPPNRAIHIITQSSQQQRMESQWKNYKKDIFLNISYILEKTCSVLCYLITLYLCFNGPFSSWIQDRTVFRENQLDVNGE